ncbi:MAG: PEP-CTERM/exosortase system-associated acyltransferase [Methylomicrobium sp.]|nr:PEP-CTERM/exosortase system-associated acyltransferase [Methylomicrobium sp.]
MNSNLSLIDHYSKYFCTQKALSPDLKKQAYNLRYRVYYEDQKMISADSVSNEEEFDEWDDDAIHSLLLLKKNHLPIGNVRLIIANESSDMKLPVEKHYKHPFDFSKLGLTNLRAGRTGEISRMAILPSFRRRPADINYSANQVNNRVDLENRRYPVNYMPMCLAFAAIELMLEQKLDYGVALMEPRLAKLLVRFGIELKQIGQTIEYFGLRAPFCIFPEQSYQNLSPEYRILSDTIRSELIQS